MARVRGTRLGPYEILAPLGAGGAPADAPRFRQMHPVIKQPRASWASR